jgi:hypothetical protein
MMSLAADFPRVVRCYMTAPSATDSAVREPVYYRIASRELKHARTASGSGSLEVLVKIAPESRPSDSGWYAMRDLFFVMPDGEIVR